MKTNEWMNEKFYSEREGLTFDDVLIVPGESKVIPRDVTTYTQLTRNIKLDTPLISAAMDTVTNSRLAIAIAQLGGIGIIHKNFSIEEQAEEVRRVKRFENIIITNPVTLDPSKTIKEARLIMERKSISGIPVVNENSELMGIVTRRDLGFFSEKKDSMCTLSEVMTPRKDLTVSETKVDLKEAAEIMRENRVEKLPLVDKDNKLVGLITLKDITTIARYPNATKDSKGRLMVGAAVGIGEAEMERVDRLVDAGLDVLVVDTAHGHSLNVLDAIKNVRKRYPKLDIIGGNVATGEAAEALIKAGVDAIKVGIGPGSICTTRVVAGIGVPQVSAIMGAYEVARKYNIPIIADGGVKFSGDIAKAIAAGADTVMIGNLFAGTTESPGEFVIFKGRRYKAYRGMGSIGAMIEGSSGRYFQDDYEPEKLVPEGIEGRVPYKGDLKDVIYQLVGGLRASMGYTGSTTIAEFKTRSKFIKITSASLRESHPHDISITKESPNYMIESGDF